MSNITADQLVQREVIYCVSTLISELAKQEQYQDELMSVCVQDDWETAARDEGYLKAIDGKITNTSIVNTKVYDSWQDCCEANDIEPQQTEAYEHWIVSGWLADKLEAEGEMVLRDFLGMTIWGRACTGQAIAMDNVIEKIHADLVKAA